MCGVRWRDESVWVEREGVGEEEEMQLDEGVVGYERVYGFAELESARSI